MDKNIIVTDKDVKSKKSITELLKNNKFIILIAVVVVAALIWYFCFRKKNTANKGAVEEAVPQQGGVRNGMRMNITKTRD